MDLFNGTSELGILGVNGWDLGWGHYMEVAAFFTMGFWMLMIFDCVRNETDRSWLWILIVLNVPGAVLYFVVRRMPQLNVPMPNYCKRWTLRQTLLNAEAAVHNLGKAHQYVVLGNVLMEMGQMDKAAEAYQQALQKEPQEVHALWGAAAVAAQKHQWSQAQTHLKTVLKLEPEYKRGDASLLYGKVLFELGDRDAALSHLTADVQYWSHPEAALLLAMLQSEQGDQAQARDTLATMLAKLRACPTFYYKQHRHLAKKGRKVTQNLCP